MFIIRIIKNDVIKLQHLLTEIPAKLHLIGLDVIHPERKQIVRRSRRTDHTFNVRRTGFKLDRRLLENHRTVILKARIHIAPEHLRIHPVQQLFLPV